MEIKELIKNIEAWGIERELDKKGTVEGQQIKTAEEISELIKGISKNNLFLIKDSIGDVFVTLVIGNMLNHKLDLIETYKEANELVEENGENITKEKDYKKDMIVCMASGIVDLLDEDYRGDILNTILCNLIGICKVYDMAFVECVESAYHEIANRKGKMIGGTFVKEEDLENWWISQKA